MLGGAIDNGDCFFDAVCQVLRALDFTKFCKLKADDVRKAVKKYWDAKSDEDAAEDFENLKHDSSIDLPLCVTSAEKFKRWLILPADFIKDRADRQAGKAGFDYFAMLPYWGGFMDLQVAAH
jgi:hypothetical protein